MVVLVAYRESFHYIFVIQLQQQCCRDFNLLAGVERWWKEDNIHNVSCLYAEDNIHNENVENLKCRTGIPGCFIGYGSALTSIDSSNKIKKLTLSDASTLKPTLMATVPTILGQVQNGLLEKVGQNDDLAKNLSNVVCTRQMSATEGVILFKQIRIILRSALEAHSDIPLCLQANSLWVEPITFAKDCLGGIARHSLTEQLSIRTVEISVLLQQLQLDRLGGPVREFSSSNGNLIDGVIDIIVVASGKGGVETALFAFKVADIHSFGPHVMDDDTNYDINLIAGLANKWLRNYSIPEVDKLKAEFYIILLPQHFYQLPDSSPAMIK
ncbi:long chain acyl-CoA synthetase [Thalictrum thalictroides]|uniref:Long chain acyl-CoA synthetase n=1 Tax=Thalictrum thalictroides TaxID=46969 RepID=A0A7J6URK5_THATH|nr:long chain acyl-CoA synthetase [Thalictrum thalictroides]